MQNIRSKVGRTRARQIYGCIAVLVVFAALAMLLARAPFGLSTSAAQAVSGGLVWSIIVLIVGNRTEGDILTLEDHVDLYRMSAAVLLQVGPQWVAVFASDFQDRAWFVLMMLSMLPCLALATITRRALFSPQEWASAAREVR